MFPCVTSVQHRHQLRPQHFLGLIFVCWFLSQGLQTFSVRCTGHTNTAWGRAAPQTELSAPAPGAPESLTATFLIWGPANQRSCSRTAWKISVLYGGRSATAFLITSSTDFSVQAAPMVTPVNKQRKKTLFSKILRYTRTVTVFAKLRCHWVQLDLQLHQVI